MPHRNNMVLIEMPDGFVLADKSMKPVPGDKVAFQLDFIAIGQTVQYGDYYFRQ